MLIAIIGFFSGILSGMGVGGGMILIPALHLLARIDQHTAQTVNLFYFIPSAVAALAVHIKHKRILIKTALPILLCGVPFSLLGAFLAVKISAPVLQKIFAGMIFIFGVSETVQSVSLLRKRSIS